MRRSLLDMTAGCRSSHSGTLTIRHTPMNDDRLLASLDIDRLDADEIVRIIQEEDAGIALAVAEERERIARAIEEIAERLRSGGRLFYAGAGTSGRIAMLDAAELPPTYGVPRDLVQVIMAGGEKAFLDAVEGAEDDEDAAIAEVARRVRAEDTLIGVAASGTTPFTVAAVRKANDLGALTIGISSRPDAPLLRECDIPIAARTGPEVIMGSSRMKSGTAQKLILNTISTGVMIRLGRVYSNLMVEMPLTNAKLLKRAARMVELAAGTDAASARSALDEAGGETKTAIVMLRRKLDAEEARQVLEESEGSLRRVIED